MPTTSETTDDMAESWTWDEFCLEMRRAGWRRNLTAGFFEHKETVRHFCPFNFSEKRQAWTVWAKKRQTPPK